MDQLNIRYLHDTEDVFNNEYSQGGATKYNGNKNSISFSSLGIAINIVAQSQNGTGKTATFSILALSKIDVELKATQCLIVVPTYELAKQIGAVMKGLAKFNPNINIGFALRGINNTSMVDEITKDDQIIIGTPGSMIKFCNKLTPELMNHIKVFILDEADVMLSQQGHNVHSLRIKRNLSPTCQILLLSATYSKKMADFGRMIVNSNTTKIFKLRRSQECLKNIGQYFFECGNKEEKFSAIKALYSQISLGQVITFCNTKAKAAWLAEKMTSMGINSSVLTSDLSVEERCNIIDHFRKSHIRSLITTNVTARGIDVEQVTMVVNYDLPIHHITGKADCETYLHRIGRTGRYGKKGIAINLVDSDKDIEFINEFKSHFAVDINKLTIEEDLTKVEPNAKNEEEVLDLEGEDEIVDSIDNCPYWAQDILFVLLKYKLS